MGKLKRSLKEISGASSTPSPSKYNPQALGPLSTPMYIISYQVVFLRMKEKWALISRRLQVLVVIRLTSLSFLHHSIKKETSCQRQRDHTQLRGYRHYLGPMPTRNLIFLQNSWEKKEDSHGRKDTRLPTQPVQVQGSTSHLNLLVVNSEIMVES